MLPITDELFCLLLSLGITPAEDLSVVDLLHLRQAVKCEWTGLTEFEKRVLRFRTGFTLRSKNITHTCARFQLTPEDVRHLEEKARNGYRHPPEGWDAVKRRGKKRKRT